MIVPVSPALLLRSAVLLVRRRKIAPSQVSVDYDALSTHYDTHFSSRVSHHSDDLLDQLDVRPGMAALDLACGTGAVLLRLARRVSPGGACHGVDASGGMLAAAAAKAAAADLPVTLHHGDMLETARRLPAASFDIVTCAWAIGYSDPGAVTRAAARCLRPGGVLALIENRRDTLLPVRQAAFHVASSFPGCMVALMDLHRRLPSDERHVRRWLSRAGLSCRQTWTGEESFHFESGAAILDWVLHTGASAGFRHVMAEAARPACDAAFIDHIERHHRSDDGRIRLAHRFVAAIAEKRA